MPSYIIEFVLLSKTIFKVFVIKQLKIVFIINNMYLYQVIW